MDSTPELVLSSSLDHKTTLDKDGISKGTSQQTGPVNCRALKLTIEKRKGQSIAAQGVANGRNIYQKMLPFHWLRTLIERKS